MNRQCYKGYGVIIFVHDFTKKIAWLKLHCIFGYLTKVWYSSIPVREVIITSILQAYVLLLNLISFFIAKCYSLCFQDLSTVNTCPYDQIGILVYGNALNGRYYGREISDVEFILYFDKNLLIKIQFYTS